MSDEVNRKARVEGGVAATAGVVVGDNPHPEDTPEHWSWMAGWAAGMKALRANSPLNINASQSRAPTGREDPAQPASAHAGE